eukprot:6137524-Pyramimonas_sp.AAC.1
MLPAPRATTNLRRTRRLWAQNPAPAPCPRDGRRPQRARGRADRVREKGRARSLCTELPLGPQSGLRRWYLRWSSPWGHAPREGHAKVVGTRRAKAGMGGGRRRRRGRRGEERRTRGAVSPNRGPSTTGWLGRGRDEEEARARKSGTSCPRGDLGGEIGARGARERGRAGP